MYRAHKRLLALVQALTTLGRSIPCWIIHSDIPKSTEKLLFTFKSSNYPLKSAPLPSSNLLPSWWPSLTTQMLSLNLFTQDLYFQLFHGFPACMACSPLHVIPFLPPLI